MTRELRHRLAAIVAFLVVVTVAAPAATVQAGSAAQTFTHGMLGVLQTQGSTGPYGAQLIDGCQWATWVAQCSNLSVYGNGSSFSDSGCGPPNGCTFGPEFQCTELAQRYAYYAWGEPATWNGYGGAGGSAYQMWNAGPALPIGLQKFAQGGGVAPRQGDLLVFNQGWLGSYWDPNGHVAVVSAVTASTVSIVQENGTPSGADQFSLSGSTVIASGYTPIIGWLHNPLMGAGRVAVAQSAGSQVAFWRGSDNHLHESWTQGGVWTGPMDWSQAWSMSSPVLSTPSVAASPNSARQAVFWRSTGGHLWEAAWNNGWSPAVDLSSSWSASQILISAPAAAAFSNGTVVVFWQGVGGDLMETWSSSGAWQPPTDWTASWNGVGRLNSSPAVTISPSGAQLLYWQSADGHLWHAWYAGGWGGPMDVSSWWHGQGRLASPPTAVVSGTGVETVLWQGTDGRLWGAWYDNQWHGPVLWDSVGTLSSAPSGLLQPNGTVTVYWQGANGDLLSANRASTWSGPADLTAAWNGSGLISGTPAAAVTPSNQQVVFWRGANGHLWETWYSGGAWSPAVDWSASWAARPVLASAPAVAVTRDGTQTVFWQGTNGHLWEAWYSNGWNGPVDWTASWPGARPPASAPTVAITPDGSTQMVFWRGTEGDLWEAWYRGGWNGPVDWSALWGPGHSLAAGPTVALTTDGSEQLVFWKDPAGSLEEVWFNAGWNGPATWTAPSSQLASAPILAMGPTGRQELFMQGSNNDLWEAWWAGSFSPPVDVTTGFGVHDPVLSGPGATTLSDGQTIVFWQGLGGHLHEAWTTGTDWTTPVDEGSATQMS
jgi:hypothetical protein